jgi:hypothetical protein
VACSAHARRKFYEARGSDALRSHQALASYRQLYELERAAKDFSDAQRLQMRQDLAVPILGQFHQWLEAQQPEVLPRSPMGQAIAYALNNWESLRRYTEAGFLAIGRVERWRGGLGQAHLLPALSSAGASLAPPCPVSTSRSSNRTCRSPAAGSHAGPQAFAVDLAARLWGTWNRPSTSYR